MDVIKALGQTIAKMFVADLGLTLTAVAVVALCATGLRLGVLPPTITPYLIAAGVAAALMVGVARGARAKS
jgi:hypothetical protein